MSVIFIQEYTAFNQVVIYQDCHNQLLNTINFILLLNFKESFFNYLNLGEKVANFSEQSSWRFSSAVGAYWKHCMYISFSYHQCPGSQILASFKCFVRSMYQTLLCSLQVEVYSLNSVSFFMIVVFQLLAVSILWLEIFWALFSDWCSC